VIASRSQRINPWVDASRASVTICKTMFSGMFRTASGVRCPTVREMARIGSFPDQFQFIGVQRNAWARVGNSVPPLLMRSIAAHVRTLVT
jgi:DNA (cytosine-5)-methyltransferase 1